MTDQVVYRKEVSYYLSLKDVNEFLDKEVRITNYYYKKKKKKLCRKTKHNDNFEKKKKRKKERKRKHRNLKGLNIKTKDEELISDTKRRENN